MVGGFFMSLVLCSGGNANFIDLQIKEKQRLKV